MTRRSCMASNRADCTLGEARLISSANNKLVKIGPRLTWNVPLAWSRISEPMMSAGSKSMVNWTRPNCRLTALAKALTSSVFGEARHALQEQVPAGEKGDQDAFDDDVLADDDLGNEAAHRGDQGVDAWQWHAGCGEGLPIENAGGLHRRCLALVASHRRPSGVALEGGSDFRCPMRSILAGFRRCCQVRGIAGAVQFDRKSTRCTEKSIHCTFQPKKIQ